MVLLPQAPTPATKAKTEAKARYLKKKKEKSKKRKQAAIDSAPKGKKAAASSTSQTPAAASTVGDAEVDSSDEEETAVEGVQVETEAVEDAVMEEEPKEEQDDSSRKRKKRRTSAEEEKDDDDGEDNQSVAGPSEHSPEPASFDLDSLPLEPFPHQPPLVPEPTADLLHPLTVPHALTTARVISFSHTVPLPEISSSTSSDLVPISSRVLQRLKDLQISSFFAVQTAVIPFLLPPPIDSPNGASTVAGLYPLFKQRDVCVSAPTGSGKTLSYVVPIVEVLQKRVVTRLRALVILPTRDLVSQTRETFEAVAKGTGLKLATVTGSQSFSTEQSYLVDPFTGQSLVDILVCTPGRLMDHLAGTTGFSLRDLRFLVIDEADRLLNQSFNDWLQVVLARTREAAQDSLTAESDLTWEGRQSDGSVNQCQKLLFSATLTRDPAKIAALNLTDPQYFIIQDDRDQAAESGVYAEESFSVPSTLKESYVVLPTSSKPLYLLSLLHSDSSASTPITNALVFTKSVESASRLVKLLQFFEDAHARSTGAKKLIVKGYSSDLGGGGRGGDRGKVLGAFGKGEIDILVCSDLIARGIDIPSVSHVISYDVPIDARKYVHRVGRTARAGRSGSAWSLVETQEARHFKELMRSFNHLDKVAKVVLDEKDLDALKPAYEAALGHLKESFTRSTGE